jgi:glycosyltransferase involved in cell wall biosynthesis
MVRFSIVLTTTDRPSLLAAGVRAVLDIDFGDFELLVSDNFSLVPAAEILADIRDKRLRIIRTDRRLAASDHWEFAFEHVRGEYVMYLGDDNALEPNILAVADRAIREHDLDVVAWRVATYFHPDWNISYGALPDRGNILGLAPGTTGELYAADPSAVLTSFARSIRLSACFPCMLNHVFRKEIGDAIRRDAGRLFWAPNPDISSSYLILGVARRGAYAFFDSFGAIGGRSRDSNLATLLSRGKATRRLYDYVEEFRGQDMFPHHEPKFVAMSNTLAATVSQAKATMPDYFAGLDFDPKTLARTTIDDLYVDCTVPWMDDSAFLAEVEAFIASLPAPGAAEIFAYRDACVARMRQAENGGQTQAQPTPNSDDERMSLREFWRKADRESKAFALRLFRETGRNPLGRYWVSGATTYVDMAMYGGRDIAAAARNLRRVLAAFDRKDDDFIKSHRQNGMLGQALTAARPQRRPAAVDSGMASAQ